MRLIDSHAHLLSAAFDDDRAAVLAAGVPPGVVCLGVCGVLAVCVGAGAGVAVVWCWLVSCCPVLLVVGGLLAGWVV